MSTISRRALFGLSVGAVAAKVMPAAASPIPFDFSECSLYRCDYDTFARSTRPQIYLDIEFTHFERGRSRP